MAACVYYDPKGHIILHDRLVTKVYPCKPGLALIDWLRSPLIQLGLGSIEVRVWSRIRIKG